MSGNILLQLLLDHMLSQNKIVVKTKKKKYCTNLNTGTGNDCAGQSNARLFDCRRSILENLLSFGSVGGFAPTGSTYNL